MKPARVVDLEARRQALGERERGSQIERTEAVLRRVIALVEAAGLSPIERMAVCDAAVQIVGEGCTRAQLIASSVLAEEIFG